MPPIATSCGMPVMLEVQFDQVATDALSWLIALGVAGMVVWKQIGPKRSNLRLVVQIVFFSAMTIVLVSGGIPLGQSHGLRVDDTYSVFVVFAQILWWLHLSWAIIGFVRIYLVLEGRPREARLLQDIVVGVVYTCVTLSALAFVFAVPVGTLIATSGVIAIALGLALQNTLGDVFSGVALNLGRAFALGDWLRLEDGTEGRITASTWRSTQILTSANSIVVLPNSALAKQKLVNVSRPGETHLIKVKMRLVPNHAPSAVEEAMTTVLAGCNLILREPAPTVAVTHLDAVALEIELLFRVADPLSRIKAQNEVVDRFYRHCRSTGLRLAPPPSVVVTADVIASDGSDGRPEAALLELLDENPIFSSLSQPERQRLAQSGRQREYRKGDVIARQGEALPSMMIIRDGVVSSKHGDREAQRLSSGDFFGETGLLAGMSEAFTLEALSRVNVYEIAQEDFARLLAERPAIAHEVAAKLSDRAHGSGVSPLAAAAPERSAPALLKSIQKIFSN